MNEVLVEDGGYDYTSDPIVTITGGNGIGAQAFSNTIFKHHDVEFNSIGLGTNRSDRVILENDTIGFSTFHKFKNGEKVIYKTNGGVAVGGLSTDAVYYANVVGVSTIKLYTNSTEAIKAGINTISLTSFGEGVHQFQTFEKKRIISSISVVNSGSGYENKKRVIVSEAGISSSLNQIYIEDHGYKSGEILNYSFTGPKKDCIGGITSNTDYFVTSLDDNNFKLSSVGVGTTAREHYYNTKQYIGFSSVGLGTGQHSFNYQPITVTLSGQIGVVTSTGQDFSAKIQPLFRGSIDSVQITNAGSSYGSEDILNYDNQPLFDVKSGTNAEVSVVIDMVDLKKLW